MGVVPAIAVDATIGAVFGGATAGAFGGGMDIAKPDGLPVVETAAPAPTRWSLRNEARSAGRSQKSSMQSALRST
ncbi:hypothetical protein [Nocardia tengchongensis]